MLLVAVQTGLRLSELIGLPKSMIGRPDLPPVARHSEAIALALVRLTRSTRAASSNPRRQKSVPSPQASTRRLHKLPAQRGGRGGT